MAISALTPLIGFAHGVRKEGGVRCVTDNSSQMLHNFGGALLDRVAKLAAAITTVYAQTI
jgi:hypothetical protein